MRFFIPICLSCDYNFETGEMKKTDIKNFPKIKYQLLDVSKEERKHHDPQFSGKIMLISCGKCGESYKVELDNKGNELFCIRHS